LMVTALMGPGAITPERDTVRVMIENSNNVSCVTIMQV